MQPVKNQRGYALVFVTLMIVLLLIMVGMGLDTGHLAYVRSQGQPAVDAAALAAASAIPSGNWLRVTERAAMLNPGGTNPGTGNNYLDSPNNQISQKNVTLVKYDNATGEFTTSGVNINNANGARVALENSNPYGGNAGEAMKSPLFLTPLLNLFGQATKTTADVSVSAVAVNQALPGLPIVVVQSQCNQSDTILDFQTGGNSTAGWETYQIINASTDEVRGLFEMLPFCQGQPAIDVGYCGNIANGVNATVFNQHLKPMFKADPNRCYLIPVIANGGNLTQCQTIVDWAHFCPNKGNNTDDAFPGQGKLRGSVTCGKSPFESTGSLCFVQRLVRDKPSGM
ncbi:MAG: pilus assembly protein TadG-related protein [Candidatus Binatia bacterium]